MPNWSMRVGAARIGKVMMMVTDASCWASSWRTECCAGAEELLDLGLESFWWGAALDRPDIDRRCGECGAASRSSADRPLEK